MSKFWPNLKINKSSRSVKFKSTNLIKKLENILFNVNGVLPDVPDYNITYVDNSYKDIRIELIMDTYKDYPDLNWMNVNYFMSNYNQFNLNITRSFWFVEKATPKYSNNKLYKVEYILHLDEWHTFYEYIWKSSGNIELLENHNKRWIKDKDGNNIVDLISNPFINNCNSFCSRFDTKSEFQIPQQIFDTKHFNFDLTPKNNNFFNVDENNNVTKQIRGWILVWCDLTESGNFIISVFDKVAVPLKLFIYPVYDNFDQNKWITGIKKIQEGKYRIQLSNIISDILSYEELSQVSDIDGWYESLTNNFRTSVTNGLIDNKNNFIDKFTFTNDEIKNELIEPHLNALTHHHYELSNPNKTSTVFDINRLIKNKGMIINSGKITPDTPIHFALDKYKDMDFSKYLVWNDAYDSIYYIKSKSKPNNVYKVECDLTKPLPENFMPFFVNSASISENPTDWDVGILGKYTSSAGYSSGKRSYIADHIYLKKGYLNDKESGQGIDIYWAGYNTDLPITQFKNWYDYPCNFENIFHTTNTMSEGITYYNREPTPIPFKFIDWGFKNDEGVLRGYNYSDLDNAGNYNDTVIDYEILSYDKDTKKYHAEKWYVLYNNELYLLPIGQLIPSQYNQITSDYFWYDTNGIFITKNIGYFSPEEMGLKSILLDTDTTTTNKLNNNTMTLNTRGVYNYPYANESYVEFMKNNLNQFNAGYANIDAKKSLGEKIAWQNFGLNMFSGTAGGAAYGFANKGIAGAGAGLILGGLGAGVFGGIKTSQQIAQIELEAQIERNNLNAKINDAKNMADNVSITGTTSTLSDTILKEYTIAQSIFKNYWNFWLPVLHKFELTPPDKDSIKLYFNKYGYKQDRFVVVNSFEYFINRWAFNRLKIANPFELLQRSGMSSQMASDTAEDLINGIWIWDIDKVKYDNVLDYSINNYEVEFYSET